jgi:hypothetical protein
MGVVRVGVGVVFYLFNYVIDISIFISNNECSKFYLILKIIQFFPIITLISLNTIFFKRNCINFFSNKKPIMRIIRFLVSIALRLDTYSFQVAPSFGVIPHGLAKEIL